MAATKPSAQNAAGVVKVRRKGCWFMGRGVRRAGSVHDVLSKPFAPLGRLLGAQLGVDIDLLLPSRGGGEDARKLGNFRIELGVENHGAAFIEPGDVGLNLRVV